MTRIVRISSLAVFLLLITWAEPGVFATRVPTMLTSGGSSSGLADALGALGGEVSFGDVSLGGASTGGGGAAGPASPPGASGGGGSAGCARVVVAPSTMPTRSVLAPRRARRFRTAKGMGTSGP